MIFLDKTKCCMQNPGPYLKGLGHNHRSKVKEWDILQFLDYNSVLHGWVLM